MLVKILSDNVSEQLRRSRERLRVASQEQAASGEAHVRARDEWEAARRAKPLWRRLLGVSSAAEEAAKARIVATEWNVDRVERDVREARTRVDRHSAGMYGEELLAASLSSLPDGWVMLRGYRNRRGETDCVLVGPGGIWAVEVKYRPVLVHAVGDRWWLERISARGSTYESEPATDGAGRSWSRQVGEIARDLEKWLRRQGHDVQVRTAVIVIHDRARVVECVDPGVDFVGASPLRLMEAIDRDGSPLDAAACSSIVRLVERDHHFHARARRR